MSGLFALAAAMLIGAAAMEAGPPTVRNDSGRTLMCGARADGEADERRVLIANGRDWTADSPRAHRFSCDFPAAARTYRLRPGQHYRLVTSEGGSGRVLLRPVG